MGTLPQNSRKSGGIAAKNLIMFVSKLAENGGRLGEEVEGIGQSGCRGIIQITSSGSLERTAFRRRVIRSTPKPSALTAVISFDRSLRRFLPLRFKCRLRDTGRVCRTELRPINMSWVSVPASEMHTSMFTIIYLYNLLAATSQRSCGCLSLRISS